MLIFKKRHKSVISICIALLMVYSLFGTLALAEGETASGGQTVIEQPASQELPPGESSGAAAGGQEETPTGTVEESNQNQDTGPQLADGSESSGGGRESTAPDTAGGPSQDTGQQSGEDDNTAGSSKEDGTPAGTGENTDQGLESTESTTGSSTSPGSIQVAGTVSDDSITMTEDGTAVSLEDNTWEIDLSSGTLAGSSGADISAAITISGLPNGLEWTAVNAGSGKIIITVSGAAISALDGQSEVSIQVLGSAVSESGTADSEKITVYVNPAACILSGVFMLSAPLPATDFTFTVSDGKATITGYTGTDMDVVIPDSLSDETGTYPVAALDISVFYGKAITSVTIPAAISTIPLNEFAECTSLGQIIFKQPSSLASIDLAAFNGCTSLTEINIPGSVASIGNKAFYNCSGLSKAYFWGIQPAFGNQVFEGTPAGFKLYYHVKNASSWASYSDSKQAFCQLTLDQNDGSGTSSSSYVDVDSSGHIAAPAAPASSAGSFAGWYRDAVCTDDFDFASDTVSDDLTLYAKWSSGKITASAADISVTLASGNKTVETSDNSWVLIVSGGTLRGGAGDALPSDDLSISGLPAGLTWSAHNAGANKIKITVLDTANPAASRTAVSVVVKGSAVIEPGSSDSDPISLYIYAHAANPRALAINQNTNTIYVANKGSNDVSVIDGNTDTITATIGTDSYPSAVDVNPDTNKIYVNEKMSVKAIDGSDNQVISTLPTGNSPSDFAINRNSNKVYVSNLIGNNVTVIDGDTNTVKTTVGTGSLPMNVELNPNTNKIYVANNGGHSVSIIDGGTDTVVATVDTVDKGTYAVAVNPVTDKVYVTNQKNMNDPGSVTVIAGTINAGTIAVGKNPRAVAVNPLTNRIYVANLNDDTVTVIDGATDMVTATINTGDGPLALGINKVTNKIFVANCGDNTVTIIDGATNSTSSVAAGGYPSSVAVNEATNKAYVLNQNSDFLTIIASVPASPVCEIVGGAKYDTLDAAIADVPADTPTTIRLLANIDRSSTLTLSGSKKITLDLNGHNLNIDTTSGAALEMKQSATLVTTGTGALNASGFVYGIYAVEGTAVNITGNVSATGGYSEQWGSATGIYAYESAGFPVAVTVNGDVRGYIGVVVTSGAEATVNGGITGTKSGMRVLNGGNVSVSGSVSATEASNDSCIMIFTGTVHVGGNVTAAGANSDGIYAANGSVLTIGGSINAVRYGISAYTTEVDITGSVSTSSADSSYTAYAGDSSVMHIGGDITGFGDCGVIAATSGVVTVAGKIQSHYTGIRVSTGAEVFAQSDIVVDDAVGCGVNAFDQGKATIDGTIHADQAMIFGESDGALVTPSTKTGYLTYSDGEGSYVWLKDGTAPTLTVAGTATDDSVTMASGNTTVSGSDNSWEITLTSGTLNGEAGDALSADVLIITGLPTGLTWAAKNNGFNKVLITVAGTASPALAVKTKAQVVVKSAAVSENRATDSAPIDVYVNISASASGSSGGGGGGGSLSIPTVATGAATSLSGSSAVLNGEITARGGSAITAYGFSFKAEGGDWTQVQAGTDDLQGSFSYSVSSLSPNNEYYFKSWATNSQGTAYGQEKGFLVLEEQKVKAPGSMVMRFYIDKNQYYVNDQEKTMDTAPIIYEERTLLPIRYVAENLGATVSWDAESRKVTITLNDQTIELWIGQNIARVNGVSIPIDPDNPAVTPIIQDPGRAMLPLRFISETLGCQVDWNPDKQEVKVTYPK